MFFCKIFLLIIKSQFIDTKFLMLKYTNYTQMQHYTMFKFKYFWCYCDVMVIRIDQFWHEVGVFNLCSTRSVRTYKDVFLSLLIDRVMMISCGIVDYTLIFHIFMWLISSLFQLIVNLPVLIFNNHRLYFDLLRLMRF